MSGLYANDWDPSACSLSLSFSQLEDDIVARPNYFTTMKNFALQQPSEEWMILEFSQLGFIGEAAHLLTHTHTLTLHKTKTKQNLQKLIVILGPL